MLVALFSLYIFFLFYFNIYLFSFLMGYCHFLFNFLVEGLEIWSISYKLPTFKMSVYTADDEKRGRPTEILFPNIKVLVTNTAGSISAPLVHFNND